MKKAGWLLIALWGLACASGLAQGNALTVNGRAVIGDVSISVPGIYEIAGYAQDAQICVDVSGDQPVTLVLDGAQVSCARGAAVYAHDGDVTIELRGKDNMLCGGSEEQPAAVYAMDDLVIQGDGALRVDGTFKNGIECRDSLTICSGDLNVSAVWDGVRGRDNLNICGGEIRIEADNDGLKANNDEEPGLGNVSVCGGQIAMAVGDDAVHAEGKAEVTGGTLTVERCFEGIEGGCVQIAGGEIRITAQDDGINTTAELEDVKITGGDIRLDVSGDGIDSAGGVILGGGTLVINGTTSPKNSALDYLETSWAEGSTLFACGSAAMAQAPKSIGQLSTLRIFFDEMQHAGQMISVCDAQGEWLFAFAPLKDYQAVVIAHPLLTQGKTIAIHKGGSAEGLAVGGAVTGGMVQGAVKLCKVKLDGVRVSIDERGNPCDFVPNAFGW